MGVRGPLPLPANVHLLKGNPGKRSVGLLQEVAAVPVEVPDIPSHLSKDARQEWKRITVELVKLGLVAKIDRAALAVYCQAFGRWVIAERRLKALGDDGLIDTTLSGYKQIGVWLQISNRAVEQMEKFLQHFGMSPSARTRVHPNPQQGLFDGEHSDPAERYFT